MDLRINRAHARLGHRSNGESCPTAVALRCAGFTEIYVGNTTIKIGDWVNQRSFNIPRGLRNAIANFDEGKPFKVGTYRISGLKRPRRKS